MVKVIVCFGLVVLLVISACSSEKQVCEKSCNKSYNSCMERIDNAEQCGFARLNCKSRCH